VQQPGSRKAQYLRNTRGHWGGKQKPAAVPPQRTALAADAALFEPQGLPPTLPVADAVADNWAVMGPAWQHETLETQDREVKEEEEPEIIFKSWEKAFSEPPSTEAQRVPGSLCASWRPPWYTARPQSLSALQRLDEEIADLLGFLRHTDDEVMARREWVKTIAGQCQALWPQCEVKVFGSFRVGLSLPDGDVDICVEGVPVAPASAMRALSMAMVSGNQIGRADIIDTAKVPIVKLQSKVCGLHADVVINKPDGVDSSLFVVDCLQDFPQMRPVLLFLKCFLLQHGLHETYTGGMGSYLLTMVVLHFYQKCAARTDTISTHLLQFFNYYSVDFQYASSGISVLNGGCIFRKHERGWWSEGAQLCVESPLSPQDNLGAPCFRINDIRGLFKRGHSILRQQLQMSPLPLGSMLCARDRYLLFNPTHPMFAARRQHSAELSHYYRLENAGAKGCKRATGKWAGIDTKDDGPKEGEVWDGESTTSASSSTAPSTGTSCTSAGSASSSYGEAHRDLQSALAVEPKDGPREEFAISSRLLELWDMRLLNSLALESTCADKKSGMADIRDYLAAEKRFTCSQGHRIPMLECVIVPKPTSHSTLADESATCSQQKAVEAETVAAGALESEADACAVEPPLDEVSPLDVEEEEEEEEKKKKAEEKEKNGREEKEMEEAPADKPPTTELFAEPLEPVSPTKMPEVEKYPSGVEEEVEWECCPEEEAAGAASPVFEAQVPLQESALFTPPQSLPEASSQASIEAAAVELELAPSSINSWQEFTQRAKDYLTAEESLGLCVTDPLVSLSRHDAFKTLSFAKVLLFSGSVVSGVVMLCCALFLGLHWSSSGNCSRPLRWWLLVHSALQLLTQVPARALFFNRVLAFKPDSDLSGVRECVERFTSSRLWRWSQRVSSFAYGWYALGIIWVVKSAQCAPIDCASPGAASCNSEIWWASAIVVVQVAAQLVLIVAMYRKLFEQSPTGRILASASFTFSPGRLTKRRTGLGFPAAVSKVLSARPQVRSRE